MNKRNIPTESFDDVGKAIEQLTAELQVLGGIRKQLNFAFGPPAALKQLDTVDSEIERLIQDCMVWRRAYAPEMAARKLIPFEGAPAGYGIIQAIGETIEILAIATDISLQDLRDRARGII